ncbi:MAG: hypothetical protein ACKOZX_05865, partial [Gammaproteobacteria bacterium]
SIEAQSMAVERMDVGSDGDAAGLADHVTERVAADAGTAPTGAAEPLAPAATEAEASTVAEDKATPVTEQVPPAAPGRPARAHNDPREVRRRQREAELKAQGILPKSGGHS